MKKILFTFILFLGCAVSVLADSTADALRWNYLLSYHNATHTQAVGNWVYTIFNGNLLAYDSETGQSYTLDKMSTGLSDMGIKAIAWSNTQQCLILLYTNNNIDLVYPTGDGRFSVTNVPQIKNFEEEITISRLSASGDWACMSTSQGVIVFDVKGQTVRGYYKLGRAVNDAFVKAGKVYAAVSDRILVGKMTDDLYVATSWEVAYLWITAGQFVATADGTIYAVLNYYTSETLGVVQGIARLGITEDDALTVQLLVTGSAPFQGTSNGKLVQFTSKSAVFAFNTERPDEVELNITTSSTYADVARTTNGLTYVAQGDEGLNVYHLNATQTELPTPTGIVGNFGPRHTGSYSLLYDHNRLFVAGSRFIDGEDVEGFFGCYDGTKWSDMDEDRARTETSDEGRIGMKYKNTSHMAVDPSNPEHVFMTSMLEGLYEYRKGQFVNLYNTDNSPLQCPPVVSAASRNSNVRLGGCAFDKEGNLWITNNYADTLLTVLKPNGDWMHMAAYYTSYWQGAERILFDSRGYLWVNGRTWTNPIGAGIMLLDYGGTLNNKNDDRSVYFTSANNEDGTSCDFSNVMALTEDKKGQIWFGCVSGIYNIPDPDECFKTGFTVNQPKVPRNDGTDYADYLLTGVSVSAICVDAGNRKWIGTFGAGVYLVNEDGSEILQHFTADNSPLLSDNVYDFAINPDNGRLYIATDQGLCSYDAGSTEAQPTLEKSNLRIFPNPVRPDYRGTVTIAGLTEGAEIKVLTTGSQLVARGTSVGGSWQWDVTQQNTGERVAPGVYYIMVATADGKTAVAGKVVVI